MQYFIRSVKYLITLVVFFAVIFTLMYFTSSVKDQLTFQEYFDRSFADGAGLKMILFFVVFAAIYPLIGYSKKDIYVSNYKENHQKVKDLFENSRFVVESETPTSITFRAKGKVTRAMRLGEDKITIDFSTNPVVMNGQRKDVLRFARWVEHICQKSAE